MTTLYPEELIQAMLRNLLKSAPALAMALDGEWYGTCSAISAFSLFCWYRMKVSWHYKVLFLLIIDVPCFRGFISLIFLCASVYLGLVILSWGDLQLSVSIFYVMLIAWIVARLQGTLAMLLEKKNMNATINNLQHRRHAVWTMALQKKKICSAWRS